MKHDTAITEVARHLPMPAAELLCLQPPFVQENVLRVVRDMICFWEESGAELDPIQWDLVLTGLVQAVTPLYLEVLNQSILTSMVLGAEDD